MELPMEFLEQMKNMLGEAYPDYLESFPIRRTVRCG